MVFLYPDRWAPHWQMLCRIIGTHYGNNFAPDDVVILGRYLREPVALFRQQYPGRRIIVFQTEPLLSQDHYWNPDRIINNIRDADEIWDYDWENFLLLKNQGLPANFCPLLSCDAVVHCQPNPVKDIDVLIYALFSERRGIWLHHLHMGLNPEVNVWTVCNVMHPEIDQLIHRSRVIVNWHQHDDQRQQEQTRFSYLLSNGKHVVSEQSSINYYGDLVDEFTGVDQMIDLVNHRLRNYHPDNEILIKNRFRDMTWLDFQQNAQKTLGSST
jgi:hypothetical protein